jgi:hypothetical protein
MKRKLRTFVILVSIVISAFTFSQDLFAQTQRNPLIEFCTGTWCQWCPCGDWTIENLLVAHPNLIPLAYHGPVGQDPYSYFQGNEILSVFGFAGYPTASVDRASAPGDYTSWTSKVNSRINVPATVSIDMEKSFNQLTGQLDATINMTALENLTGQFKYSIVLTEDSLIYNQVNNGVCVTGGQNWVHYWVVRSMINGYAGEDVNSGSTWNMGDMISKTISYSVPSTFNADKCNLVVFVYKQSSPMYLAQVQQAEQWTLISPDYVATMSSSSPDVIIANNSTAEFTAVLYNRGLLDDTYNITASIDGPAGWTGEFTTENGTFQFGELDSVHVTTDDSTSISVAVNPNYFNGSGVITLECASKNDPGMIVNVTFNVVTSTGVHLLVVDASEDGYGSIISNTLDGFYEGRYGVVSRGALNAAGLDLSYFTMIAWAGGNSNPAFYPGEVDNLQDYLDGGGNLLLEAHNLGSDIFEAGGQSQFAQSFFNNYLHSNYVADFGGSYFMNGFPGDPITDGIQAPLNSVYTRSPDEISAFDAFTTPIVQFGSGPKINSIRVDNGNHRVVYFGFAFEQFNDVTIADTLVKRSVEWLTEGIVLDNPVEEPVPSSYTLEQNYPNPFNPATTIAYSIPQESQISLKIYDVMGREVVELVSGKQSAGAYSVEFDAASLASGTYFYKLTAGEFISVKKMVLLK